MSAVEVIQIDEDTRLRVEYDPDAQNPTTWGDHVQEGDSTWQQWADGQVYGVILERRVTWGRLDDNGEMIFLTEPHTMHTWEEAESLWGCYLDETYTARAVAEYHGWIES